MTKGTFIVKYDSKTGKRTVLLVDAGSKRLFPFNSSTVISGLHKYEDMLIFHDNNESSPFKINLKRVDESNPYYEKKEDVMLIKAQPDMPNTVVGYDSNLAAATFNNNVFWFALRYRYEDGEVSAISPYSGPKLDIAEDNITEDSRFALISIIESSAGVLNNQSVAFCNLSTISPATDFTKVIESNNKILKCICAPDESTLYIVYYDGVYVYNSVNKSVELIVPASYFGEKDGITGFISNVNGSVQILGTIKDTQNMYLYKRKGEEWVQVFHIYTEGSFILEGDQLIFACSDFGNIIYTATISALFRSVNNGETNTWENVFNVSYENEAIAGICCSSNGSVVFVSHNNEDDYFISRSMDFGKTFDQIFQINGAAEIYGIYGGKISCSSDGRIVFCCGYVSNDYGNVFRNTSLILSSPSVSQFGKYILGYNPDGVIYISRDFGDAFTEFYNPNGSSYPKLNVLDFYRTSGVYRTDVRIAFPVHRDDSAEKYFINDRSNFVDIEYNTGSKHVTNIEILMKKGESMYIVANINKKENGTGDNELQTYRFTNTELYRLVATKDVLKLFDNVPLTACSSTIIQNALMFGNYYEGFDTSLIHTKLEPSILNQSFDPGNISLKTGTKQKYGIVYYDYFGRCTPVLNSVDIYVDNIRKYPGSERRIAKIKITGAAPDWASKYKIARGTPNISFDFISGFSNVYPVNNKLYVEITGFPWVVPKSGDYLELISDSGDEAVPELVIPVFDFYDNSGHSVVSIKLSDGTHVAESRTESSDPVPPGRYIIIDPPSVDGYRYSNVLNDNSKYGSSNFYIVYENSTLGDVLFNEIPYEFRVENGLHKGNQKGQEVAGDYAECLLEYDGDVILMKNPTRELNKYPNNNVFTTLGRTIGKVENYRRIHRFAGLCVSEPYVEDTGYNGLASFNQGLINYKDLEKNHREIELIDGFDTNVEVYQRDKVSVVQYRKNVLATASGERMVAQSQDIFGEQQMYAADYGMDNFRSYAKSGTSRYFVDGSRGAVLRKDMNGIVPISRYGMEGWLFDELTKQGSIAGVYDTRHNSYVLCLKNEAVNFLETNNGWSSFFSFVPDAICNTNSGVFSFKDGILYRHDVKGSGIIYGKEQELVVRFICNDFPDVIKVFNAVMVESSVVPSKVKLISDAGESEIDSSFFERKEGLYLAYIPMCHGVEGAEYVMAGVCGRNYSGKSIPLLNQGFTAIHKGDAVYKMVCGTEGLIRLGNVLNIGVGRIDVDESVELLAGDFVICADLSQINGNMHRGRYMEVEMHFDLSSNLVIKTVQTDVDESKI